MKSYRYLTIVPVLIALPCLFQGLYASHLTIDQLQYLMSPATAIGLIIMAILWFMYISGYKYSRGILVGQGFMSLLPALGTVILYLLGRPFPFDVSFRQPGSHLFLLNLTLTFIGLSLIQILNASLQRTKIVINIILAYIMFIALLSISGHLYSLDDNIRNTFLMPIPPSAIAGCLSMALIIFVHTNQMRHLYLNKRILSSFFLMLVAVIGVNAVVYLSINRSARSTDAITAGHSGLADVYNVDLYLNRVTSDGRSYEATGESNYVTAYQQDKQAYLKSMRHFVEQSKNQDTDVQHAVQAIQSIGTGVLEANDQVIALKQQRSLSTSKQSAIDSKLDTDMDQVFVTIQTVTKLYSDNIARLAIEQASSSRDIITGISVSSALTILLILFTPLFIRQTISELSLTEEKLEESYKRLSEEKSRAEEILVSIGDGIFAVANDHTVTLFNKAAEKITGMKAAEVVGQKYEAAMQNIAEESGGSAQDFVGTALAGTGGHINNYEAVLHKTGRKVDLEITTSPIKEPDGTIVGAISVFRDRTSERALEIAKDEFLSLASHQLRTPATATKQFLAMFLQGYAGTITDQQRKFLQEAYDNNELGITIIEELLNIARLESGKLTMTKEAIDLVPLIKHTAEQHAEGAAKHKQHIKLDLPKEPVMVTADASMMGMVIDNLVSNALKYSFEGSKVTVELGHKDKHVVLKVSDTGVGIKPEDIQKLFKRFSRLEDPNTAHVSGTGIGLYLVKKITDMHHAKLHVQSVHGKGTTFIVEFNVS